MARFGALGGRGRPPKGGIGAVFWGGWSRLAPTARLRRSSPAASFIQPWCQPTTPSSQRAPRVQLPLESARLTLQGRPASGCYSNFYLGVLAACQNTTFKIPYTTLTPPTARHASHHPLLAGGSAAARPRTRRTRRWWTARATRATARAAARSAASALSAATWPTAAVIAAPTAARSTARAKSVGRTTAGTRTRRQGALAEAQFERHRRPESSERC